MPSLIAAALTLLLLAPAALAAGRELAPRPLIPTGDSSLGNLSTASAGGRFLTAWNVTEGGILAVYGALSGADGRRLSPEAFIIAQTSDAGEDELVVVGTDDSFAVFHIDGARNVRMTNVAVDGRVLDTRTLELPPATHMSVAWNGERFLAIVFRDNYRRFNGVAALLDRDGTVLRGDIPIDPLAADAHIAVTGQEFIAFTSGRDFFAHVISGDGSVRQFIAGDPGGQVVSAHIGDGRLLVVYSLGDGQVRACVWKDRAKLSERNVTVERGFHPVGLMAGEGRHLLVFQTDGLRAMQLTDDGEAASDAVLVQPDGAGTARAAANGDVVLAVHRHSSARPVVASAAVHPDLAIGARETLSIRPAAQSHVLVGAGGGSMLAVWNEATPADDFMPRIRTAVIGRGYESESVRELTGAGRLVTRSLAWNGTEYLVVYQAEEEKLLAVRLTYDGEPIGEPTLLGHSTDPRAAVTWAGDRWAVAWASGYGESFVHYRTMSRSGNAAVPQELDVTANLAFDVALAFDGSRVHLAWIETAGPYYIEPPPQGHAVLATRLRRDGRILDAAPLAIPVSSPPRQLAMAGNREQVVLLVDDYARTAVHVLSADARQLVSSRVLLEAVAHGNVAWDGYEFVAAAVEARRGPSYLRVWRLGDDGLQIEDPRIAAALARTERQISVASSPAYDAVVGMQEWDAASGSRAVIYAEREMFRIADPNAARPRP